MSTENTPPSWTSGKGGSNNPTCGGANICTFVAKISSKRLKIQSLPI